MSWKCRSKSGRWTRGNSNLGNGNLRPETFGENARNCPRESPNRLLRPILIKPSYGNVVLSCAGGNHVGLYGLPGGGRSPAKLVSDRLHFPITGNKQGKSPHFGPEWRFLPGFFIASTSSYEDNSLGNRTGNKIAGNRDLFELKQGSDRHFRQVGKTGLNAEVR